MIDYEKAKGFPCISYEHFRGLLMNSDTSERLAQSISMNNNKQQAGANSILMKCACNDQLDIDVATALF